MLCLLLCLAGCGGQQAEYAEGAEAESSRRQETKGEDAVQVSAGRNGPFTVDTEIREVMHDPVFGEYGRLSSRQITGIIAAAHWGISSLPGTAIWIRTKRGNCQHPVAAGQCRRYGLLRHLYRGRKSGGSGKRGHRAVFLPGGSRRTVCGVQCGRRFRLCGSYAG